MTTTIVPERETLERQTTSKVDDDNLTTVFDEGKGEVSESRARRETTMMIPRREREGTPEQARRVTTTSTTMTLEGTRSSRAQVR
jgi:hypothetical protein